jgi:hypothetical protein
LLWLLILLQFVLPFFAMLSERVRYGRRPLMVIATTTLGLRLVEALLAGAPEHPRRRHHARPQRPDACPHDRIAVLWFKSFALMARRPLGPAVTLAP